MAAPSQSPNTDSTNADGSVDFSGGIDSLKVTTVQSQQNPNGLARNELAWLINGTVRDGGITPRGGWKALNRIGSGSFGYQGGFLYQPIDGSEPYYIFLIGGRVYRTALDGSGLTDLFSTAYVLSASDKPSITLKNNGLIAGNTIPVAADIQSYFGLPATFVAPAVGASKTFFTGGNIQGQVGQTILFYGSFTVTASSFTFNSSSLQWTATLTLQNQSYPVGQSVTAIPFGDPHGIPINTAGSITNYLVGWTFTPFNAPAVGGTVNVTMTRPVANKIGNGLIFFNVGADQIAPFDIHSVFVQGKGTIPAETITVDGSGNLVDTLSGTFDTAGITFANNSWCGRQFVNTGTVVPSGPAIKMDCTAIPGWTFDSFTWGQSNNSQVVPTTPPSTAHWITVTGRIPNPPPTDGLTVGSVLNFQFGVALVTNVNNNTFGQFGEPGVKPFFEQANEFLVIQAGDKTSLPLIWDGTVLRKSLGINDSAVAPGTPGVNEIPPAGPMRFYMGRLWYSQANSFGAGDITGGTSGTAQYQFRDAVLNVTENPLVVGGDGFQTPANEGDITALNYNSNQDAALGQGTLFAFTRKAVHALTVPVTRGDWINASSQNQPKLVPIQLALGTNSDRSVVSVNGDLFYQDPTGNIRSLLTAVRYFGQWGNIPVSANINRLIQFNDQSLLNWGCGIYFNNRMIQTALPISASQGTVHQALSVLDMEEISSFGENLTPTWEGMYEGLDILQMFVGIIDGTERAFAAVVSRVDFSLQLWELTADERFDNTDRRIQMIAEFPAFTWGQEFSMKETMGAELWIDRLFGEVVFKLEYRPDGESCWYPWHEWKVCSPRNSCENTGIDPCTGLSQAMCYPLVPYGESYRQTLGIPKPPRACSKGSARPAFINYQCQPRLTVVGFCRVRGFLLHAAYVQKGLYQNKIC
jgi:hypothetical protein